MINLKENQKWVKDGLIGFSSDGRPCLNASRCRTCGKVHFPSRVLCTACYSEELEKVELCGEGVIYSMTEVFLGAKGIPSPYISAWIDFCETRIAAIVDWDPARIGELHHGQKVSLDVGVIQKDDLGNEWVSYLFRPIFEEDRK